MELTNKHTNSLDSACSQEEDEEKPAQIPSYRQFASTLKELNIQPMETTYGSLLPGTAENIETPKIVLNSRSDIPDPPSLHHINHLPCESKATTSCSLQTGETIGEELGFLPFRRKKPSHPPPDSESKRSAMRKQQFHAIKRSQTVKPDNFDSPSSKTKGGAPPVPPLKASSVFRKLVFEDDKSKKISERDPIEEEWDEKGSGTVPGKRWKKVMTLMHALSKLKKNNNHKNSQEIELNKKQLELLYDFGIYQDQKSYKNPLKTQLSQSEVFINPTQLNAITSPLVENHKGKWNKWRIFNPCWIFRSIYSCFKKKNKVLPEGLAKDKIRRKAKQTNFWAKLKAPISPSDKTRLRWDILLMIFVVIDLIILPLQISFSIFESAAGYEYLADSIFIIDILLNFHTAFYHSGDLVTKHREIAKNYAKSWLCIDIISAFPFHAIDDIQTVDSENISQNKPSFLRLFRILRLLKILRALRFFKLSKIFWKLKVFFGYSQAHSFFQLLKLIIIVLLLTHWLACIWHLVAVIELEFTDNETWIEKRGILNSDAGERYINSLYWSVTTMLTVGYGDITPVSVPELWCAVFSMFVACGVFAYSLNTIGTIINDLSESRSKVSWKIYSINKFMQKKNMAKEIQERVRGYMEHLLEEENNKKHDQEEFLALMPDHLKKDILIDLNGKILTENIIFNNNFASKFLQELATKLQESSFGPGENICLENGKNQESNFYIVTKGRVQLFFQKTNQTLNTLTAGEYFGEVSFFSDGNKIVSAKSANYSRVFYLEKSAFLDTLENYPREKESFCEIKDKVNLYHDLIPLRVKCFACDKENHLTQNCPQLQYIPDPEAVIKLVTEEDEHFRRSFVRRNKKSFNALNNKSEITEACEKLREEVLGIVPQRGSRNSSLTIKQESKLKRSHGDYSFDSDHLILEEDKEEKPENYFKQELLSLIQEDVMEEQSNVLVLSPKSMTLKFKELSQFADTGKGDTNNKPTMKKKKKVEVSFDKVKIFSRYFVHNNADAVISRINRLNKAKRMLLKQESMGRRRSTTDSVDVKSISKKRPLFLNTLSAIPHLFKKDKSPQGTINTS